MSTAPSVPKPIAEWYVGALSVWHQISAQTDGALAMAEVTLRRGSEPPMHRHTREDELFYVIEGTVLFQRDTERIEAPAGTSVWLPRGIPHGFALRSETARLLHIYTPGGLEEAHRKFSEPAAQPSLPPAPTEPPDLQEMVAEFERHGVEFVGPPLSVLLAGEVAAAGVGS